MEQPNLNNDNEPMKMPENQETISTDQSAKLTPTIIGVLVVVLMLILGGLYLWGTTLSSEPEIIPLPVASRPSPEVNNEPESTNAEADVQILNTVSTSDEITAIEADLESTNLEALDAELSAIDIELDAALSNP
jgi:flagellar basal body-associated protein FliL